MKSIEKLREEVRNLYMQKDPNRSDWADWIYEKHVVLVADESRKIASEYGGNPDNAEAAGLLHDIADAVMKREDERHEEESLHIARVLLQTTGFSEEDIKVIVDDAIVNHGCHGDNRPITSEGKAMASGDGVVHLMSDFYEFAEKGKLGIGSPEEVAKWALPKLDRDFHNKIAYDKLRNEVESTYLRLKTHFQNLLSV